MGSKKDVQPNVDVYKVVTNRIIQLLEQGIVPWRKSWSDSIIIPQNMITRRPYRGINVWLLNTLEYPQPLYLTWRQIIELGATVKKGEHANLITYWNWVPVKKKLEITGEVKELSEKKAILRYYYVFNLSQCNNIPPHLIPQATERKHNPIEYCESIIAAMPQCPPIIHKSPVPLYDPFQDYVNMPPRNNFINSESYYETLFHELVHCTGHEKRLKRKKFGTWAPFGSEPYSVEELVAEMGACYLKSFAGIAKDDYSDNAANISGWLSSLRNDKRFIVYASAKAQQAIDYILNYKPKKPHTEEVIEDIMQSG